MYYCTGSHNILKRLAWFIVERANYSAENAMRDAHELVAKIGVNFTNADNAAEGGSNIV